MYGYTQKQKNGATWFRTIYNHMLVSKSIGGFKINRLGSATISGVFKCFTALWRRKPAFNFGVAKKTGVACSGLA